MVNITTAEDPRLLGGACVTTFAPATGYVIPPREELDALRRKVYGAHPELSNGTATDDLEFLRAFWAQGQFFRIPLSEQKRSFSAIFDEANLKLAERGFAEVDSRTFLAACIAAADCEVRLQDRGIGQLLECGLNPFAGRQCDPSRWMAVAAGAASLPGPMPPRSERARLRAEGQGPSVRQLLGEGGRS